MSNSLLLAFLMPGLVFAADHDAAAGLLKEQVEKYLDFRKQATAGLPKLKEKATPEQIEQRETALAKAIRAARAGARQGEILQPSIAAYLKELVRSEMKGAEGKAARETAKTANPRGGEEQAPKPVKVAVNAVYPDAAPASSVPPTLLLRLPKLPETVDFRFVGRHLVLRDIEAGLIIDFIPNAMPGR